MLQYKTSNTSTLVDESLKERFNTITSRSLPSKREVTLKYNSCCGCGCSEFELKRTVDFNSPLQDGDYTTDYLDTDILL